MFVEFGNAVPKEGYKQTDASGNEVTLYRSLGDEPRVTFINIPEATVFDPETGAGLDGYTVAEAFKLITDPRGMWINHSDGPPVWVASDTPALESFLARHFHCEEGKPDDVEETHHTMSGPPGVGPGLDDPEDAVPVAAPPEETDGRFGVAEKVLKSSVLTEDLPYDGLDTGKDR